MDNELLFHDYMNYKNLDVNKLTGRQFYAVVKDYEQDKCDLNFPLNKKRRNVKIYIKKCLPQQFIYFFRNVKKIFNIVISSYKYYLKKNTYKYNTIYIAAGSRCAGTWLKEILIMVLDGYIGHHPHRSGPGGGNFDINLSIANNIKKKYYVICTHTPPKTTNIKILDEYVVKYLVTIRDPRDVVVSLYYHIKKYPCGPTSLWDYGTERDLPWPTLSREILQLEKEEIIDILIERILPGVINLMEGWVDYSLLNKNILIVKYEELKSNTLEVIRNILSFYEVKVDDTRISETIDALNPRNNETIHINYSSGRVPIDDKNYLLPHNDWHRHLTSDQIDIIEEKSKDFYNKAGYSL